MKKIISIILSVLMLFSMGISPIQAVSSEIIAEISKVSVLPGGKAEVFINLKCNSGIKTLSFIDFIYDDSVLTLIESECAWLADGIIEDIDFENDASIITFGNNTSFDGNIFKLVFEVSEDVEFGSFPVSCDVIGTRMIDKVETRIDISITAGEILVVDSTTTLNDFDYALTSSGIAITGYKGDKTDVIISETYEIDGTTYDVVGIEESAFEGNEDITSVVIPSTVKEIGAYAFYDCTSLASVTIYSRDAEIGEAALGYYYISRREDGVVEGFTIYAYEGSTAKEYAETDEEMTFSVLEEPACNHQYGTYVKDIIAATCTNEGYTGDTYCKSCDVKLQTGEKTDKLPHTPAESVIENRTEPRCEVKGSYDEVVYCSVCETELSRTEKEIPALEHIWDNGVIDPVSTCKTQGTKTYTCQNDASHKRSEQVALDSTNHEGGTEIRNSVEANCGEAGYTGDTYCLGCNTKIADGKEIPATGRHNYVGTVTKVATCKSTGVKTYTCSVCGDTYTDAIPVDSTNHEGGTEIRNAVTGNCGEAGYTGDTYCLGCNTKIADGKEIPATGNHTYGNWVVDETDTKKMTRTCSICGDIEESAVYLAGRSLLFKDIIQIRYYFDFSRFGADVVSTGLLIWSEDEYKAMDVHDITTAPYKMTNLARRGNTDTYYGESAGIPAKNMIDNQYAIAYAELKDGTIEYTETCTFSPVVYCQTILAEGGNFEATMKNLAAALMNYGAAAQLHFKYKTDTLMNAWMADELKAVAFDEALIQSLPEIDDSKFTLTNDENIIKVGSSLTFVGNIMQNMYFDIENDDIANAREVKLLYWTESEYNKLDSLSYVNARKADLVYDETNSNKTGINCYRTVLEGVSAKDLRGAFMFAVYYKDAEGNEFYGPLFADGAHDYVRRVLITNTAATMKNLAKAFFMYHIAAEKHLLK